MAIRADDASDNIANCHAIAHLRYGRIVMPAKYFERAVPELRQLGTSRGYPLCR